MTLMSITEIKIVNLTGTAACFLGQNWTIKNYHNKVLNFEIYKLSYSLVNDLYYTWLHF